MHRAILISLLTACGQGGSVPNGVTDRDGDRELPRDEHPPLVDAGSNDVCAEVRLEAHAVTPNVVLVVDRSGSMKGDFAGAGRRWDVVRDTLVGEPDGLVPRMHERVRFGLALYHGTGSEGTCPAVSAVLPAPENLAAISAVYGPAEPVSGTPTGQAVSEVLAMLASVPDPPPGPTYLVLATDGRPDTCEDGSSGAHGDLAAVSAVAAAFDAGIRTFVISVGEGSVPLDHLQDVANAGQGVSAGEPDAPYFEAADVAALEGALHAITGGILSCTVGLDGRIDPVTACRGTVILNERELACGDADGWRPVDEEHIELLGAACEEATAAEGAIVEASFPCDVILI